MSRISTPGAVERNVAYLTRHHHVPTDAEVQHLLDRIDTPALRRLALVRLGRLPAPTPTPMPPAPAAAPLTPPSSALTQRDALRLMAAAAQRTHPTADEASRRQAEGRRLRDWPVDLVLPLDLQVAGYLTSLTPEDFDAIVASSDPVTALRSALLGSVGGAVRLHIGPVLTREACEAMLIDIGRRILQAELGEPLDRARRVSAVPDAWLGTGPNASWRTALNEWAAAGVTIVVVSGGQTLTLSPTDPRVLDDRTLVAVQRFVAHTCYRPIRGLEERVTITLDATDPSRDRASNYD